MAELTHVKVVAEEKVIEPTAPFLLGRGDEVWVCDESRMSGSWVVVLGVNVIAPDRVEGVNVIAPGRVEVWYQGENGSAVANLPRESTIFHRWTVRSEEEIQENERHSAAIGAIRRPE